MKGNLSIVIGSVDNGFEVSASGATAAGADYSKQEVAESVIELGEVINGILTEALTPVAADATPAAGSDSQAAGA